MKRGFRAALALVAALAAALAQLAGAREAAAWAPLDLEVVPRWSALPVRYHIHHKTIPGPLSGFAAAGIEAGFAAWSSPACTACETELLGDTDAGYDFDDGKNVFLWLSDSWPAELGQAGSVIAITMPVWGTDSVIDDADMVFNNVGFCWDDAGEGDCIDLRSIATHEEGHFLGLGHSNVRGATMLGTYRGGTSARTLEDDDIEGVCALYPIGGTTAPAGAAPAGAGDRGRAEERRRGRDRRRRRLLLLGWRPAAGGSWSAAARRARRAPVAPAPGSSAGSARAVAGAGAGERAPRVGARTGPLYNPAQPGQTCRHARAEHRSIRGGGRACPPLP